MAGQAVHHPGPPDAAVHAGERNPGDLVFVDPVTGMTVSSLAALVKRRADA